MDVSSSVMMMIMLIVIIDDRMPMMVTRTLLQVVSGVDIMVVRELTGDVYFGEPKGITTKARHPH